MLSIQEALGSIPSTFHTSAPKRTTERIGNLYAQIAHVLTSNCRAKTRVRLYFIEIQRYTVRAVFNSINTLAWEAVLALHRHTSRGPSVH